MVKWSEVEGLNLDPLVSSVLPSHILGEQFVWDVESPGSILTC